MPGMRPLGKLKQRFTPRKVLQTSTVRDFGGGWNVVDSDLNLSSRFAKVLKNLYRQPDGSNGLRCGTRLFAKISEQVTGDIINMTYFNGMVIAFTTTGRGVKVDGSGVVTEIWSPTLAALLPDTPAAWANPIQVVNFAQFKGDLIVVNGIDKPLIIDKDGKVKYLQDIPTSSNVNVPIGKYIVAVGQWLIIAGLSTEDIQDEGTIFISNTQSSGTWPGDEAPNDGIEYQVGAAASLGTARITGLVSYRSRLLVLFNSIVVVLQLGNFTEANVHDPQIEDSFPQFGSISHRSASDLGYDVLFCDFLGVPSFVQSAISSAVDPKRASELIDPEIQKIIAGIDNELQLSRIFAVYHSLESLYMLFIPNGPTWETTTETRCFAYHSERTRKGASNAWAEFAGWKWSAGCRSDGGRIFFADRDRIYIMGDTRFNDEFYADRVGDYDADWAQDTAYVVGDYIKDGFGDGKIYKALVAHTSTTTTDFANERILQPTYWEEFIGFPIEFDWEFPWVDFKDRMYSKEIRYIHFDTTGDAQFTCEFYIDNLRRSAATDLDTPALSMLFTGGTSGGFGNLDQPYGGGRRTIEERAWAFNHRFKIMKLRIKGNSKIEEIAKRGLRMVSLSIGYVKGSILR